MFYTPVPSLSLLSYYCVCLSRPSHSLSWSEFHFQLSKRDTWLCFILQAFCPLVSFLYWLLLLFFFTTTDGFPVRWLPPSARENRSTLWLPISSRFAQLVVFLFFSFFFSPRQMWSNSKKCAILCVIGSLAVVFLSAHFSSSLGLVGCVVDSIFSVFLFTPHPPKKIPAVVKLTMLMQAKQNYWLAG